MNEILLRLRELHEQEMSKSLEERYGITALPFNEMIEEYAAKVPKYELFWDLPVMPSYNEYLSRIRKQTEG
ncbi:hypothetical protein [Bacillus sp. FJAT-28004]|uniref:hypothetical protein n=1 Tax=Bacillus sp. FJAT-28004 TaxID=1679165 RepID=UPI0006B43EF8|nr:hypothetical protein [Bacillus sp. FJAT-28004]